MSDLRFLVEETSDLEKQIEKNQKIFSPKSPCAGSTQFFSKNRVHSAQPKYFVAAREKRKKKSQMDSGSMRVARGGYGAKAQLLAARPKLWSDPCGARLAPGLKPLRLPRAQNPNRPARTRHMTRLYTFRGMGYFGDSWLLEQVYLRRFCKWARNWRRSHSVRVCLRGTCRSTGS